MWMFHSHIKTFYQKYTLVTNLQVVCRKPEKPRSSLLHINKSTIELFLSNRSRMPYDSKLKNKFQVVNNCNVKEPHKIC